MTAIEVLGLRKSFGEVVAVDDLTFDVPLGRVTGFLGPNGAGKSTTLRMVLGLIRPDAGRARVLGRAFTELDDPARMVGALLDVEQFHPRRSGRNHLAVLATAAGIPQERVDAVLDLVELSDAARRGAGGYSLGMKQRLGLAAALLGDPQVLVLDEPANGLDPAGMRWLRTFLRTFAAGGRGVFVSSHLLSEVAAIAQDVVVIDGGRLVAHSPVADLVERSAAAVRVLTPDPERLGELFDARGIRHERVSPDTLRAETSRETVGRIAADEGIAIFGLEEEEHSLEDVFFELTGSRREEGLR